MDRCLRKMHKSCGVKLGADLSASALAFADDVVLCAELDSTLRMICTKYCDALALCGL